MKKKILHMIWRICRIVNIQTWVGPMALIFIIVMTIAIGICFPQVFEFSLRFIFLILALAIIVSITLSISMCLLVTFLASWIEKYIEDV